MHTQCPDCKTKFLVNDDQLRVAQGKVRCSKCHKVFNALGSLQKPPQTASASIKSQPATPPDTVTDFMAEAELEEFSELKAKISSDLGPQRQGEEKTEERPSEQGQEIDDDLSEVLKELERMENHSKNKAEGQKEKGSTPKPSSLDGEKTNQNPKSTLHDPLELLNTKRAPKKKGGLLWSIGILLLLAVALSQIAWFGRDKLMHYPEGRMLLQTACKYVGCQLPTIRAPEKIQVLSRSITMHPKIENALLIQLTIANQASFSQPQPLLQISLFSSDERLVVQRRFKPSEYLADNAKPGPLPPGKAMYVELAIEDPGNDVTGFKLDFF